MKKRSSSRSFILLLFKKGPCRDFFGTVFVRDLSASFLSQRFASHESTGFGPSSCYDTSGLYVLNLELYRLLLRALRNLHFRMEDSILKFLSISYGGPAADSNPMHRKPQVCWIS